jgi:hypothetical protein
MDPALSIAMTQGRPSPSSPPGTDVCLCVHHHHHSARDIERGPTVDEAPPLCERRKSEGTQTESPREESEEESEESPSSSSPPACTASCLAVRAATNAKNNRGWRKIVQNFAPSWFSVTMGTGIVSMLLHNLPYNARWLRDVSYVLFALNVLMFVLFCGISVLRYAMYPRIWMAMIRHPAQSLFLGTFPMSLATIINMMCYVCVPAWGGNTWRFIWALWWVDAVIAVATCTFLPFTMYVTDMDGCVMMFSRWVL